MSSRLDVYLYDQWVGKLRQEASGQLQFQYEESFVSSQKKAQTVCPISVSLPFQEDPYEGQKVRAFFSGLLPDDRVRHRLARYLGISEKNPFGLLEAIGGECAGALSLYPEGMSPPLPSTEDVEKLDDTQLREILDLLKSRPLLAGQDNLRLSLAGAQDKIAVSLVEDSIALVKGTTPTSHILKPMIEDVPDSVHNELFCLTLAKNLGIEAPRAEIRWMGQTPYFLVERYDRQRGERGELKRLHQEDFCQALGVLPEFKYEREGGPSVAQSLLLLEENSQKPAADRLSFIKRVILNYLIGNSDAHGKNFSLIYRGNQPVLAPAYDLLSTAVYPALSPKMAMKIGGHYEPHPLFLRYWHRLVPEMEVARKSLNKELETLSKNCVEQASLLTASLKKKGISSPLFKDIEAVIQKRSSHLLEQLSPK